MTQSTLSGFRHPRRGLGGHSGASALGTGVLALLAALALWSCADDKKEGGVCDNPNPKRGCERSCTLTEDCDEGLYCNSNQKCWADCDEDHPCPDGQSCGPTGICSGSEIDLPPEQVGFDEVHDGGVESITAEQKEKIEDAACAGESRELESIPAVLQIVQDTSRSMTKRLVEGTTWEYNGGSGSTKWEITHPALAEAIDGLGSTVAAGLVFFPNRGVVGREYTEPQDISACFNSSGAVPVDTLGPSGSEQRQAITAALDAVQPDGNTPTFIAYNWALENGLRQAPDSLQGNRYMLLITDGVPTFGEGCVGDGDEEPPAVPTDPIIELIANAYEEDGTQTFVIGSPGSQDGVSGSDARPWLSEAAQAGHTAPDGCSNDGPEFCHMDMTQSEDFAAALKQGLGVVASQLGECTYRQPTASEGETIDADSMRVILTIQGNSEIVWPDNQDECSEGWQLVDGKIVLCEDTCNRAKEDPSTVVEVVAGCEDATIDEILR